MTEKVRNTEKRTWQGRKTFSAGFLYFIGNMSTKAVAFFTVPVFTRLLTASEYGIVNTYTSWVHIASVVVTLSLYNSFRVAYAEKADGFDSYCASVIRLGGILSALWCLAGTAAALAVPVMRGIWWMVPCCLIQAFGMFCVTALSTSCMLKFRYRKRAVYMTVPNLSCALLAVMLLVMHDGNRLFWRIAAYTSVYAAFAVAALWTTRKEKTDTGYWRYAVSYSMPLVFHGLSLVVLSSSDRIMITHMAGAEESGIYSLAYNIGLAATAAVSSLEGLWVPWFIGKLKRKEIDGINRGTEQLVEAVSVIIICVMLTAPEVLQFMAPQEYWRGKPVIYPVVAASYIMFLYDLAVSVEYQTKNTQMIALNTFLAAVINVVLNLLLIPHFGAVAAAFTTVAAYAFSLAFHYYCARKSCPGIFPAGMYAKYAVFVAATGTAGALACSTRFATARWGIALTVASVYVILRLRTAGGKKKGDTVYALQKTGGPRAGCLDDAAGGNPGGGVRNGCDRIDGSRGG